MEQYLKLVHFLGRTLPHTFEIILFDTSTEGLPVMACEHRMNGTHNVSRQLVSDILREEGIVERGGVLNRPVQCETGKLVKTSVYLVKNEKADVIGAVCLNMQCDFYFRMQSVVSSLLQFDTSDDLDTESSAGIEYVGYAEPSLDMIAKAVEESGVQPERMTQDERMEIICDLYDLGVFELKGSVSKTAEQIHMSEQSVYRYLSKIKKARA